MRFGVVIVCVRYLHGSYSLSHRKNAYGAIQGG